MHSTRSKLRLTLMLGRHETPHSGLWVYGRNLVVSLIKELEVARATGDDISLHLALGGDELLRSDLARVGALAHSWVEIVPQSATSRKWGMVRDLLACFDRGNQEPAAKSVVHGTANMIPLLGSVPTVLSLHDLLQVFPFEPPRTMYQRVRASFYRILLGRLTRRASLVVTVHPRVKRLILKYFPWVRRVEVVYSGLDECFLRAPLPNVTRASSPYLLAFVSRDPRKNIEGALRAFAASRDAVAGLKLKVISSGAGPTAQCRELSKQFGIEKLIEVIEQVPQEDMPMLYAQSQGVLFPSRAEGFGYPIYEALSVGVPVVCEGELLIPELREAGSSFVFPCAAAEVSSITTAARAMLTRSFDSTARVQVAQRTREVVSADVAARKLLKLYREVLSESEAK